VTFDELAQLRRALERPIHELVIPIGIEDTGDENPLEVVFVRKIIEPSRLERTPGRRKYPNVSSVDGDQEPSLRFLELRSSLLGLREAVVVFREEGELAFWAICIGVEDDPDRVGAIP
jgi:hypothetical protein